MKNSCFFQDPFTSYPLVANFVNDRHCCDYVLALIFRIEDKAHIICTENSKLGRKFDTASECFLAVKPNNKWVPSIRFGVTYSEESN